MIPHKAFQALAVGTPLITADTEAARELLVGGRDSLLVERTADSLAEAIVALRDDPELAERDRPRRPGDLRQPRGSEAVLGVRWRDVIEWGVERNRARAKP